MKFEEILPLLKQGKMACFENSSHYLYMINRGLFYFTKDNNEKYSEFDGHYSCLRDDWMLYEPAQKKCIKEKRLIDFSVNWYPTRESMDRNEKELLAQGWETFKKESFDYDTGIMTYKLMMVKYEN